MSQSSQYTHHQHWHRNKTNTLKVACLLPLITSSTDLPRHTVMCYSTTNMGQDRASRRPEDQQQWQGIYPDIASFFANNAEGQQQQQQGMGPSNINTSTSAGVAPLLLLLQQVLGLTPEEHQQETPSAPPPPSPTPSAPPSSSPPPQQQGPQQGQHQGQQQPCGHCGGSGTGPRPASCSQQWAEWKLQHPELAAAAPVLLARCRTFAAAASRSLITVTLLAVAAALLVSLPSSLATGLVLLVLAPRLGLHLPTLLTGYCLLSWLSWFSPFSHLLVLGVWVWRLHRGQWAQPCGQSSWINQ